MSKSKTTCGVGINDSNYKVSLIVNGKSVLCNFYQCWRQMINRCYHPSALAKRPTYMDCSVCDEWLTFSNFKAWMEIQDWKGKQLDKDLLVPGNKVYSPECCVFIDRNLNSFISTGRAGSLIAHPGVSYCKTWNKIKAYCGNPFNGKTETLGYFKNEEDAALAWRKRKHEFSVALADMQSDERIASALRTRYL